MGDCTLQSRRFGVRKTGRRERAPRCHVGKKVVFTNDEPHIPSSEWRGHGPAVGLSDALGCRCSWSSSHFDVILFLLSPSVMLEGIG